MSLQLRWVDERELDRIAETRMRCYAASPTEFPKYRDNILSGRRARIGDHLLAERDGQAVGTATSLSMTMWARGSAFPAQGVGDVGTIKTHRRGGKSSERGIASVSPLAKRSLVVIRPDIVPSSGTPRPIA